MEFNVVTQRVVRILRTLQQGAISPALQQEAYDQLKDYCASRKGMGGRRALRVLECHRQSLFSDWSGEDPCEISGKEYFARAWIFANLCADSEEAKQALVLGLSNAVNDQGNVVCVYGTLNHITITLFMGRLYGIAREDTFYQPVEECAADYFTDTRKVMYGSVNAGEARRAVLEKFFGSKDPGTQAYKALALDINAYWQASIPNKRDSWQSLKEYPKTISLEEFQAAVRQWIDEYYKSFE